MGLVFVVGLGLVIAAIVGAATLLVSRRRTWLVLAIGGAAFVGSLAWFLHPVCVVIPGTDLASFNPPIETRTDTGMIGEHTFQQRNGSWYQCKTWIARAMFF
jgi:hypothetical protein